MKWRCVTNAWFAVAHSPCWPLRLLPPPGTHLEPFHQIPPPVTVLKVRLSEGRTWHREREDEDPRDVLALLQAFWGPVSHLNRMRVYQLPGRSSPIAVMNQWLGTASWESAIPSAPTLCPALCKSSSVAGTDLPWSPDRSHHCKSACSAPGRVHPLTRLWVFCSFL